jgi:glutamate synthase (NADPH/NADH) small chain
MPERTAEERAHGFDEVDLGFDLELALREAERCLQCAHPACVEGCPVGVQVAEFIGLLSAGDVLGAAAKLREGNVLPAITGRVCPQEQQCEGACVLGKRFAPVGIGHLERFVADWEAEAGRTGLPVKAPPTGKAVAIVGSGPAGLAAAGDLVQRGHRVKVFEALHELGGVLTYGIPEFRLPKSVVRREVGNLRALGVEFETGVVVGRTLTVEDLLGDEGYDAVFIATGAGLPRFLEVPGEHLNGVYSANEFLTRVNLMRAYRFPEYDQPVYDPRGRRVAVFGGGNTALDAARTALRMGARETSIVYRRTRAEMPARAEEIRHAKEEGVRLVELASPVEFLGNRAGWLEAVRLIRMELGGPDSSGRARPLPVEGSELTLDLEMAIIAIGTGANPLVQATTPDLAVDRRGYIEADPSSLRTSRRGVFAGGDVVTGSATVILAMGAGRRAAGSIHAWLEDGEW